MTRIKILTLTISFLIGFIATLFVVQQCQQVLNRNRLDKDFQKEDLGPHFIEKSEIWKKLNPENCQSTLDWSNKLPVDEDEFMKKNIELLQLINIQLMYLNEKMEKIILQDGVNK